MRKIKSTNIHS